MSEIGGMLWAKQVRAGDTVIAEGGERWLVSSVNIPQRGAREIKATCGERSETWLFNADTFLKVERAGK